MPHDPRSDEGRPAPTPTRRRFLTALGAAAMPAAAGCGGSPETETGTRPDTETAMETTTAMQQTTSTQQTDSDAIDPRFGYIGTRTDSPPVEPDHTVTLELRPREGVPVPEFYFEPTGLAVDVGDTVRFDLVSPHHNVDAYHPAFGYTQRVPTGVEPYSSPILAVGDYWLYTFEAEGVHNIMRAPHELFGMVGSIVVGSPTGPGATPVGEAPAPSVQSRPPEFTAGLVPSDPAMAPDNTADAGAVSWSDLAPESKRPLLRPVEAG